MIFREKNPGSEDEATNLAGAVETGACPWGAAEKRERGK